MERAIQIDLVQRLLGYSQEGRTHVEDRMAYNPVSMYTDPAILAQERELLFRRRTILVGYAEQVREPGDYLTHDLTGVPILVVRGRDNGLRAFLNVCRHRGARVAEDSGNTGKTFTCPYHAWSWDTAGRLAGLPDAYGFSGMDDERRALVALPVAEQFGMVWVVPTPDGDVDIAEFLAPLVPYLGDLGLERWTFLQTQRIPLRMNWKVAVDTFWETYHVPVLHRSTIAPYFDGNRNTFDALGPHHLMVTTKRGFARNQDRPQAEWDLLNHASCLHSVFPNTAVIYLHDHVEVFSCYPDGDNPDACVVRFDMLIPEPPPDEETAAHWQRNVSIILDVTKEDFATGEGIQRGFRAGANESLIYGRFEAPLAYFHAQHKLALGIPPWRPDARRAPAAPTAAS